jgi:Fe-S cluster biogenesis protein NfuA
LTGSRLRPRLALTALLTALAALALALPAAASAAESFPLELEVSGEGSVSCSADAGPLESCESEYEEGTELTLIAEPESGSELLEWQGDCDTITGSECEVEINEAKTIEAVFGLEEFELEVKTAGSGEGTVQCEVDFGPTEPCPASESYPFGAEVTLYAEAEPGSQFSEWGGDCTGEEPECTLTVEEALSVTATFEPGPFFALNIEEPGTGEGSVECEVEAGPAEPCEAEYPQGALVTVIAEAAPGSEFTEWGGECDIASGNECEVEISEERTIEVVFEEELSGEFHLTIAKAGTGAGSVECEVNGGSLEPCEATYPEGTELVLVATPETGSEFAGYSSGNGSTSACSSSPCAFALEANSKVTATFNLIPAKFALKVKKSGTGAGKVESTAPVSPKISCGTECEAEFTEGTKVTLTQSAAAGSEFIEWAGACSGTGSCEVTISEAKEVTATFNLKPVVKFALKVKKSGTGTGKVTSTPAGIDCGSTCEAEFAEGTKVTLAQSAAAGSEFIEWAGACTGSGSCEVTISEAKEVTATFNLKPVVKFALKVKKTGTGTGTVTSTPAGISCGATCSAEYESGKVVELKESAEAGSEFVKWSGACTGTGACEVTMSSAKEVSAEFKLKAKPEFKLTIAKAGTGSGSVSCNATTCAATYPEGTEVTLAATAASGSTFAGFSGAGCSGTGSCKVTITADTTVTATFNANEEAKKEETKKEEPKPTPEGTAKAAAAAKVKSGKAELKLSCTGGPCKGTLRLKAKVKQGKKTKTLVIGKASFSIADGATATLKVKLSGPAKQELAKGKTVKAKTSGTGISSSTVKLKQAKKK